MKKVHGLLAIAIIFLFAACKKDKSVSARMDLITTGTWTLNGITSNPGHDIDGDGILDTDIFAFYEDCEKDNTYTFKAYGNYVVDEGPSKCDPSDPQVSTTHWQFANNENDIIIDGDRGTIEVLNGYLLVIRGEMQGETYTFTFIK